MMKGLEATSDKFLADMARIQDRAVRVQNQLSSGLRVQRASDAPEAVANIFRINSQLQQNAQIDQNLTSVQAEVNTGESVLEQAVKLLERANTLGTQTAGNSSNINRPALADEVKQLHQQLVSLTQATSQGRFIFSGDQDQAATYKEDWSQPTGVQKLTSASNTRLVQDATGGTFSVAKTATELFDERDSGGNPTDANVFAALHDLGKALENDDQAAVAAAMPKLQAALDKTNQSLTFYGNAQNRVSSAITSNKEMKVALTKELGDLQDTDMTSALMEMSLVSVQQQAALSARAKMPNSSLFDYLG